MPYNRDELKVYCQTDTETILDLCAYLRHSLRKWVIDDDFESCNHLMEKSNLIVDMISKQEKLKPVMNEFYSHECPVCKNTNITDFIESLQEEIHHNFCPDCGQAIDWEIERKE